MPRFHEQRELGIIGHAVREPRRGRRDPALLEQHVREVLVLEALDDFRGRQKNECAHLVAGTRQRDLIEICERNDQVDALLLDELAQSRDVSIVLDSRHERMQVGVVESGSERIDVRGNRDRTGLTKRLDDVDALSRTREENRRHGVQYSRNGKLASAEAARTAAAAIRHRPGRRSTA